MKGHISTEVCLRTYTHFTLAHDDEGMTYFSLSGKEGVSAINFCETQCRSASFCLALLTQLEKEWSELLFGIVAGMLFTSFLQPSAEPSNLASNTTNGFPQKGGQEIPNSSE